MKLGVKEKNFLLAFLGILMVVVVYFFVYKKMNEETDGILALNSSMNTAIVKLEGYQRELASYEEQIFALQTNAIKIKNTYPSMITSADKMLYANKLENQCEIDISYLGMEDAVVVDVPYPQMEYVDVDAEMEGLTIPKTPSNPHGVYLMKHGLTFTYTGGYESMKQLFRTIINDAQEKAIHNFSMAYNPSTGVLSGSVSASMYSLTGTNVVYNKPQFSGVSVGTDDIFKTVGGQTQLPEVDFTTSDEADIAENADDTQ